MSDGAQFSFSRLGRTRKSQPPEFGYLLKLCPAAVLTLDLARGSVLQGNSLAVELTGYSTKELSTLNIQALFPDWELNPLDIKNKPNTPRLLQRKDNALFPVLVENWDTSPDHKYLVMILRAPSGPSAALELNSDNSPWPDPRDFFNAFQAKELPIALDQILKTTQKITNTESLAIYYVDEDYHHYTCKFRLGNTSWLPLQLAGQDVVQLHSTQVWVSNKRPTHPISRAGHESKQAFVASFPIYVADALKGFLVLADAASVHTERLTSFGPAIAGLIAIIIQKIDLVEKTRQLDQRLLSAVQIENIIKNNILEGCLVLSPGLQITEINTAAERILGYGRNQVNGQPVERVLIGTETLNAALLDMQQNDGRLKSTEVRLYRRSGEAFLAELQAYPARVGAESESGKANEGSFQGSLILFQDLTQQENAREQTRQLEQRAILGEITAVFAHEVRNPINNISTGLELIALTLPPDDPNQPTITRLLQDCDRLADLMKSVLSYSRPAEYTMSVLNLEPFLNNLLERMRPRLERVNAQGLLQAEANLPPIMGSPRALEQVFSNLINNAIQALGENGGQVILKIQRLQVNDLPTSKEDSHFVEVNVIDTGPGIPEEFLERLFQPFFTTNASGTGLGLAIAKRIITAHRGSINVTSFPGGTVFHVRLPTAV